MGAPLLLLLQLLLLQLLQLPDAVLAAEEPPMIEITAEQAAQIIGEDGSVIDGTIIAEGISSTEPSLSWQAVTVVAAI